MTPRSIASAPPAPADLRDKALNLREAVNSSRARMHAQREQLARLRSELAALRALAEKTAPPAPLRTAPSRTAPLPSAPLLKEAASDSAPAAAPFKTGAGFSIGKAAPYAAILAVAIAGQLRPAAPSAAGIPLTAAVSAVPKAVPVESALAGVEDDGADEALLLVHDWRLPGDDRPLSERLDAGGNPPGSQPAWTAERTGERTYRVSYRPSPDASGYDFDVDLDARSVEPAPGTAEMIAPRLASRR
jgi:hypothetical protein